MSRTTEPFPRSTRPVDGNASLRNWPRPEPPPRPSLDSAIDGIFRQAEQAQRTRQQPGEDRTMTATGPLSDIHGPRDVANRIANLKADGIEQMTDPAVIKAMKPAEMVQAQREGRLLEYMTTPTKSRS